MHPILQGIVIGVAVIAADQVVCQPGLRCPGQEEDVNVGGFEFEAVDVDGEMVAVAGDGMGQCRIVLWQRGAQHRAAVQPLPDGEASVGTGASPLAAVRDAVTRHLAARGYPVGLAQQVPAAALAIAARFRAPKPEPGPQTQSMSKARRKALGKAIGISKMLEHNGADPATAMEVAWSQAWREQRRKGARR